MADLAPLSRTSSRPLPRRGQTHLDCLYEAGKILTSPLESNRMLLPVLEVLASFMDLRHGAVALRDEEDGDSPGRDPDFFIATTTLTNTPQSPDCNAIPVDVARTVLRTGVPIVIQNVAAELGAAALPPGANPAGALALIAVPIGERSMRPHVQGVLCAFRERAEGVPFALGQDLRLLSMVGTLMAQSLRFRRMVMRDRERLMEEARQASKALKAVTASPPVDRTGIPLIIGASPTIEAVIERIRRAARTQATVLLRGESGTGKELFAQAIHDLSERRGKPFVKVNCAALSENLLESELFGHEKGAFTGALAQRKGRFELAEGGTLFLDEIGEISPAFQAKLLRVLQDGAFERVGGTRTVKVDVRLIAATNRDLEQAVASGEFRADLYFRICVIPIVLPPLRERPEDVPRLAETFLHRFNSENGTELRIGSEAMEILQACKFPGNVRELENCVSRLAALAPGPVIEARDLPCQQDCCLSADLWRLRVEGKAPIGGLARLPASPASALPASAQPASDGTGTRSAREELIEAMEMTGWVQAKAARLLGMTSRQIGYALKKHGIDVVKL